MKALDYNYLYVFVAFLFTTLENLETVQSINQSKKNLYSAVYSTDSEALGRRIKWGRRDDTDKF